MIVVDLKYKINHRRRQFMLIHAVAPLCGNSNRGNQILQNLRKQYSDNHCEYAILYNKPYFHELNSVYKLRSVTFWYAKLNLHSLKCEDHIEYILA